MSATTIIDTAPLGALIRYTDGSPKPPARFTPFEKHPVDEVVTNGLVVVFGVDGVDLVSGRNRDVGDCPVHLRRKCLFTGGRGFLW